MAKLSENTVVVDDDGKATVILAGEDVPSWATKQIGSHLLDGQDDDEDDDAPKPYRERKMADLKDEIDRRNADRTDETKIDPEGRASIESYSAALDADDAAQAAGGSQQ